MAYWQGCRIVFHHFCPSFSYVEDWQAFPVESQTVNIRFCEPFGLCHNSPAGPLLHESSQTHKQMADGCVPTKLNLSTLNCTFHDTLRVTEYSFIFFSLKGVQSILKSLRVQKQSADLIWLVDNSIPALLICALGWGLFHILWGQSISRLATDVHLSLLPWTFSPPSALQLLFVGFFLALN